MYLEIILLLFKNTEIHSLKAKSELLKKLGAYLEFLKYLADAEVKSDIV